jgi:hypothetical protein
MRGDGGMRRGLHDEQPNVGRGEALRDGADQAAPNRREETDDRPRRGVRTPLPARSTNCGARQWHQRITGSDAERARSRRPGPAIGQRRSDHVTLLHAVGERVPCRAATGAPSASNAGEVGASADVAGSESAATVGAEVIAAATVGTSAPPGAAGTTSSALSASASGTQSRAIASNVSSAGDRFR